MKKRLLKILFTGFLSGVLLLLILHYEDRGRTVNALYNYIPLLAGLDFTALKIKNGKIYYTAEKNSGGLSFVIDYIQQGKYADKVHERNIPAEIEQKAKNIKVYGVNKEGDLTYFTLGGAVDDEWGVFYSKQPELNCSPPIPKLIRRLYGGTVGEWFYFKTF